MKIYETKSCETLQKENAKEIQESGKIERNEMKLNKKRLNRWKKARKGRMNVNDERVKRGKKNM